ncbi:MAG: Ig domain-containing protein [Archangium sp.]|nr:Ig domain-containing protein [Archangium sp.]
MLNTLLLLAVAAPFAPQLQEPADEAWTRGQGAYFSTSPYADDAGVAPASLRVEFRRDDAGYGGFEETRAYSRGFGTSVLLPTEGARWCYRVSHLNTLGQSSPPSGERCFRTDWSPPTEPAFVDAGAIVSTGRVFIEAQPATDNASGVGAYFLQVGPSLPERYQFPDPPLLLPLVAWVGEGTWVAWVRVDDVAGNYTDLVPGYAVPLSITANPLVPTPEAPVFEASMVNAYGSVLHWDGGWMADGGVTHVVASFCNLDAGCRWRHGFHSVPAGPSFERWLQVVDEGTAVARLAVVQGGEVGPWSAPSQPLLVDRTPPPVPPGLMATPLLGRTGPVTLSWSAVVDNLTGWAGTRIEQLGVAQTQEPAPATSALVPVGEGIHRFRVASSDGVGNQSGWSAEVTSVIDSTGPVSMAPVALGSPLDGGALVSLSWALPVDALSGVVSQEMEERSSDGGAQVFAVTGLGASRLVGPGTWRWALRATDAAGNAGAFSGPSNVIVVDATGVAVGPAIGTGLALDARCGEPFGVTLTGSGDAPLTWALVSGPPGLALDAAGQVTWTPPEAASGPSAMTVELRNAAGTVSGTFTITVSCAVSDGGAPSSDAGPGETRALGVGCGCGSADLAGWGLAVLGLFLRRRARAQ